MRTLKASTVLEIHVVLQRLETDLIAMAHGLVLEVLAAELHRRTRRSRASIGTRAARKTQTGHHRAAATRAGDPQLVEAHRIRQAGSTVGPVAGSPVAATSAVGPAAAVGVRRDEGEAIEADRLLGGMDQSN